MFVNFVMFRCVSCFFAHAISHTGLHVRVSCLPETDVNYRVDKLRCHFRDTRVQKESRICRGMKHTDTELNSVTYRIWHCISSVLHYALDSEERKICSARCDMSLN